MKTVVSIKVDPSLITRFCIYRGNEKLCSVTCRELAAIESMAMKMTRDNRILEMKEEVNV